MPLSFVPTSTEFHHLKADTHLYVEEEENTPKTAHSSTVSLKYTVSWKRPGLQEVGL